jgi:hypothetical protein
VIVAVPLSAEQLIGVIDSAAVTTGGSVITNETVSVHALLSVTITWKLPAATPVMSSVVAPFDHANV